MFTQRNNTTMWVFNVFLNMRLKSVVYFSDEPSETSVGNCAGVLYGELKSLYFLYKSMTTYV